MNAESRYQELIYLIGLLRRGVGGGGTLANDQFWAQITATPTGGSPSNVTDHTPTLTTKTTGRLLVSGYTSGTALTGTTGGTVQLRYSTNGGANWNNVPNAQALLSSTVAAGVAANTASGAAVDGEVTLPVGATVIFELFVTPTGPGEYDTSSGQGGITAVEVG